MTEKAITNIYQKIARIMGRLDRMPKTGKNTHFGYKYVTDADVADAIRAELAQENIAFFASMVNAEQQGTHTIAEFEFTFACADSGEIVKSRWFGEADDKQDKGLSKAATSAEKYFLLKTFMLSTGDPSDDTDHSAGVDKTPRQSRPKTERKSSPRKKNEPTRRTWEEKKHDAGKPRDDELFLTISSVWDFTAKELTMSMAVLDPDYADRIFVPMQDQLSLHAKDFINDGLGINKVTDYQGTLEEFLNDALLYHDSLSNDDD